MTASDLREPTIPEPASMLIAIVNRSSLVTNDDEASMTRASGVSVSNFVTPAWFDPLAGPATRFDVTR
jgi:hypothetical protein